VYGGSLTLLAVRQLHLWVRQRLTLRLIVHAPSHGGVELRSNQNVVKRIDDPLTWQFYFYYRPCSATH
jgi:hypothetical protein